MKKIQWHPTFCSAIRLEFKDYPTLEFIQEYVLSNKPIQVDMLIIKKPQELQLANSIGEFFKGYNIVEYKSPTDHNYNQFAIDQALAYGYYYKQKERTDDLTVTLIVSKNHFNIVKWLNFNNIKYAIRHKGIYTLEDVFGIALQICVVEELNDNEFNWITMLSNRLTTSKIFELISNLKKMRYSAQYNDAQALAQTLFNANKETLELARREVEDVEAFEEVFKDVLAVRYAKERAEGEAKGHAEGLAEGEVKGMAKGRLSLITQFIRDYGIEKAKTMLKPSEQEIQEALNML